MKRLIWASWLALGAAAAAGCTAEVGGRPARPTAAPRGKTPPPEAAGEISAEEAGALVQSWLGGDVAKGKLVAEEKCRTCHPMAGKGLPVGPPMEGNYRGRLDPQVSGYVARIEALKAMAPKVYETNRAAIESVRAVEDGDARLALWLSYYVRKPLFDRSQSKMKPVSISDGELKDVIAFVMSLRQ